MKEKAWERSTRKIELAQIPPEINAAIQKYLQDYNLGPILNDAQICVETRSTKKKMGLMDRMIGGSKHHSTFAILTPHWLVVASLGEKPDSIGVLSVQLKDAVIMDHRDHPAYQLLPERGVHVTGLFTGRVGSQGEQRITYFLGLGEDAAGNEFLQAFHQGIQSTRL